MLNRQGNPGAAGAARRNTTTDLLDELEERIDRQLVDETNLGIAVHDLQSRLERRGGWGSVTAICLACGRDVDGMRSDARYCSNACRQRAYRTRKAAAR